MDSKASNGRTKVPFFFFPVKKKAINKYKIEVYTLIHLLIKKPMSSSKNKNGVPTVPYQAIDVSAADIRRYF
jgi:hypothetical protein